MYVYSPRNLNRGAELDRLGDEIAELSAHLDAATARLLDLIREFDARGGWNTGFRSCAAWLSWRVGLDLGAAREHVRVARALGTLPRLAQALARGELSYSKVRALTRVATPETEERLLGVGRGRHRRPRRAHRARLAAGGPARRGPRGQAAAHEPGTAGVPGRGRHGGGPRTAGTPRPAPLLRAGARRGARDAVPARGRGAARRTDPAPGAADHGSAAGRRADPPRRDGAPPRARSRRAGRALPGGGPCRCLGAGGPGAARAVRPRGRRTRFRGNVPAPGVRREPGGDAARRGRSRRGDRGPDADDSAGAAARLAAPRPEVPLPGLRIPLRAGASRSPLGEWRADHALESRSPVSSPPSRSPRAGLPDRATPPTARSASGGRTAGSCPTCRRRPSCPPIRSQALRARSAAQGLRVHARTDVARWLGERLNVGWAIDVLHPLAARRRSHHVSAMSPGPSRATWTCW